MERVYKGIGFGFCLLLLGAIFWIASSVFLIGFAAVLLALFLFMIGMGVKKLTHLHYRWALFLALFAIVGIFTLIFWLYSPLIATQFSQLMEQLPKAFEEVRSTLPEMKVLTEASIQQEFFTNNKKIFSQLTKIFTVTVGSFVGFVIFILVGFYLAFDPYRYVEGGLNLIPPGKRGRGEKMVRSIGSTLQWWLLAKGLSMIAIGILVFFGLWILDVSLALILALLAAVLAFIPYVGSILASIPAILLAFGQNPMTALYVVILYLIVHALEGYLITPFLEQRTVSLPPALTILSQILFTLLFGPLGLALATPLLVLTISMVHQWLPSESKT
ncbi:MAG: AI-2 transport protein TqsA [Chlamydiae bacterium]|nr:AI-2 transport protein TqsA [Chlamydiota bacterium]